MVWRSCSSRGCAQAQNLATEGGQSNALRRLFCVALYATAMALLETVVVVYLRGLLSITGDEVSLGSYTRLELWREAATLIMLATVGWMAGRRGAERLAYSLFAFALWDIAYYIWLKALIGWPQTLFDWDVLFLIPVRWWGPVAAPVLIALLICADSTLALLRISRGSGLSFTPARAGAVALGALTGLYVFVSDSLWALLQGQPQWSTLRPSPFNWPLFLVALVLMALPSLRAVWPRA